MDNDTDYWDVAAALCAIGDWEVPPSAATIRWANGVLALKPDDPLPTSSLTRRALCKLGIEPTAGNGRKLLDAIERRQREKTS